MHEWNVVVSLNEQGFKRSFQVLGAFGQVAKTPFYNVLVMRVDDTSRLLEALRRLQAEDPGALSFLSRLVPVTHAFFFQSPEEFEESARGVILSWAPAVAGKGFHVRMHRRGFKGRLSSLDEEHALDHILLEATEQLGLPAHVTFDDPDSVIAVETISQRAGLSLWTREDLRRYPFVRID